MGYVEFGFEISADLENKIRQGEVIPNLAPRNQSGQITGIHPASNNDQSADLRPEKWTQITQAAASWSKENPLKSASGSVAAVAALSAVVYGLHKLEVRRLRHANRTAEQQQLEQAPKALPLGPSAESEILRDELVAWMNAAQNGSVTVSVVDKLAGAWEEYADAYKSVHGECPRLDSDIVGVIDGYSDAYRRVHKLPDSLAPQSDGDLADALEAQRFLLKKCEEM